MVVSGSREDPPLSAGASGRPLARAIVWHELECGSYRADLALWRELADAPAEGRRDGPILDIGAGTGRVALDLARAGHRVCALERDPALLRVLAERAGEMPLETICADARAFELERRDFRLCIVPMQTIQLFGGSSHRGEFLRRAREHLRPGGLLACAIVTALEPFDCAAGDVGPTAETACIDRTVYSSRATLVHVGLRRIRIERERRILEPGQPVGELDVVELDRLSASQLEREGVEAGLTPAPARLIGATEDHVGSVVVMLRA